MAVANCAEGPQTAPAPVSDLIVDERPQHQHEAAFKHFFDLGPVETAHQKPVTILGLRRHHFFLFVTVLIFVVLATVGASVGGVISVRNSRKQPEPVLATAVTTKIMTMIATQPASGVTSTPSEALANAIKIDNGCPKIQKASDDTPYTCNQGQDVKEYYISSFSAISVQQCMDYCVALNTNSGSKKCKAVTVGKVVDKGKTANCWLKEVTGPTFSNNETTFLTLDD